MHPINWSNAHYYSMFLYQSMHYLYLVGENNFHDFSLIYLGRIVRVEKGVIYRLIELGGIQWLS